MLPGEVVLLRRFIPCLLVLAALACLAADGTREALIERFPFYGAETGDLAPVYPALARQIVDDFWIREGVAVDVGGGAGSLAIALAEITDLRIYSLDINPAASRLCGLRVDEAGLTGRVVPVEGDALDMPFKDGLADLVVSRGSIFFWADQLAGAMECHRILAPGGVAYIGGGFSRTLDPAIRTPLAERVARRLADPAKRGDWRPIEEDLVQRLEAAGAAQVATETEPQAGWWIVVRKATVD